MNYSVGSIGRFIVARFDHGEDLLSSLKELCKREEVKSGWVLLFGAVISGDIVVGPKGEELPPEPVRETISVPHEVIGTGSIAEVEGEPSIHLHGSFGSPEGVLTGCLREKGKTFIVVECLLLEAKGIEMTRREDRTTGLHLIDFGG